MDGFHNWFPFMALASQNPLPNRPLLTQLSEHAIVAVGAAFFAIYANDIRHSEQIDNIKASISRIEFNQVALSKVIEDMRKDLYSPKVGK